MESYTKKNIETIEGWIEDGWEWGAPIDTETYRKAKNGEWDIYLTPTRPVPHDYFPPLKGAKVLGLASGGGQQMPIMAALGAEVTLLDLSQVQLDTDAKVARREKYDIRLVNGDITKPLPFKSNTFDLVLFPVANCYIESLYPLYKEISRILKQGGILLSGLDNGLSYLLDENGLLLSGHLPFNPLKSKQDLQYCESHDCGYQFSHDITENIQGQIEAGLTLTHVSSDTLNAEPYKSKNIPFFYLSRSIKL